MSPGPSVSSEVTFSRYLAVLDDGNDDGDKVDEDDEGQDPPRFRCLWAPPCSLLLDLERRPSGHEHVFQGFLAWPWDKMGRAWDGTGGVGGMEGREGRGGMEGRKLGRQLS